MGFQPTLRLFAAACAVWLAFFSHSALGWSTSTTAAAATPTSPTKPKGPIPPPLRDVPGRRVKLTTGVLFVPDFFDPAIGAGTEVVLYFHGAAPYAQMFFHDARRNAVLVAVSMPMDRYAAAFRSPDAVCNLLDETTRTLAREQITTRAVTRVCVASFSGGWDAVDAILRSDGLGRLLTDVVLADSLYPSRLKGKPDQIDPAAMEAVVRFAREASTPGSGETFWFSQLYPPEAKYRSNSTTLAADFLIKAAGLKRHAATGTSSRGAKVLYRAEKGGAHVLGYAGMTTQDHFEHLYGIADLLGQTSLTPAGTPVAATKENRQN